MRTWRVAARGNVRILAGLLLIVGRSLERALDLRNHHHQKLGDEGKGEQGQKPGMPNPNTLN